MPKLITVHHPEHVSQQARGYVKSYILFPSGLVGLICLVGAVGGLGYQLMASDSYTWTTFYYSSGLLLVGVVMGVAQTGYHRYLLRQFPEVFAARMRQGAFTRRKKGRKEIQPVTITHRGRQLIPLAYVAGVAGLLGGTVAAITHGQVSPAPAVLMPWAGFFWGKLFYWRNIIK